MATATKTCRVCGKIYEACLALKSPTGTFRWQEVACSPECGQKYLRAVLISRGLLVEEDPHTEGENVEPVDSVESDNIDGEVDSEFYEIFDSDDEDGVE